MTKNYAPQGDAAPEESSPLSCQMLYDTAALCRRYLNRPERTDADVVRMASALIYVAERIFVEAHGPGEAAARLRRAADHLDAAEARGATVQ